MHFAPLPPLSLVRSSESACVCQLHHDHRVAGVCANVCGCVHVIVWGGWGVGLGERAYICTGFDTHIEFELLRERERERERQKACARMRARERKKEKSAREKARV